ncbi:DNA polymerase III, epsilon subunit [Hoeflea phototrophica DFL-43]|jgi:DNA polymerase III epsilon subunit-like protein|uniref:DNA polymerase III, epsilon subunit n=1 Tax=Hoeflea phototrophica (strain DSM 17068 / NCIMB 14078 / DFL-43) TaxID=411684 RepID=A9D6P1_HOEPD|nr:exonuclease domain-containing protein [Hoeflea phototrophica]EDQ33557.1 DNA polymerase III, epsilon subunit [Hoeflea phototrophica DFL-43]
MKSAIIFDCEFLTIEGSPQRFWCGPYDPDPVIAQIGAVRLGLEGDFPLTESFSVLVKPLDRHGRPYPIDPFFTRLTGINEDAIKDNGLALEEALGAFDRFTNGDRIFSWGKDEFNLIAISTYVTGIAPPIPVTRFSNACDLLLAAGMPYDDLRTTRSNTLPAYFEVDHPPLKAHDATDDARAVAYTLQHLFRLGRLSPDLLKSR